LKHTHGEQVSEYGHCIACDTGYGENTGGFVESGPSPDFCVQCGHQFENKKGIEYLIDDIEENRALCADL